MVSIGRPGLHPRGFGHGVGHGTGSWLSLLRSGTKKVCPVHDLGLHGLEFYRYVPMVLLGLLFGFLTLGNERIYW